MQVHDTPWLFPSKRPTIYGSLQSCKKMPTIEMGFPAFPAMPRIVCSEVLKKIVIVLSMRRYCLFVCDIGSFDPLCVRSPLDTLESGVLFHIWWLSKQLIVLHDSPPWKVALCLPYPTTPSPPRSQARGGTINYETLCLV